MWLAFYNKEAVGDILLLDNISVTAGDVVTETIDNVTFIYDEKSGDLASINIDNISKTINIEGNGHVQLSSEEETLVNEVIKKAKADVVVEFDNSPKLVVGYVEEKEAVKDSDHLNKTLVNVGEEKLQIVCGAANVDSGQHVIVAKVGAVMPDGLIIKDGELRGVKSSGMICSKRELGLEQKPDEKGIWVLPEEFTPGTSLDEVLEALN